MVLFTRTIRRPPELWLLGLNRMGPRLDPNPPMAVLGWYIFSGCHSLNYPQLLLGLQRWLGPSPLLLTGLTLLFKAGYLCQEVLKWEAQGKSNLY